MTADVVDNVVIRRPSSKYGNKRIRIRRQQQQHLCLDKGYNSENEEQELIKRGYVLHIPPKIKRDEKEEEHEIRMEIQQQQQSCLNRKKYSAKKWVVERTNSWHNRFRTVYSL